MVMVVMKMVMTKMTKVVMMAKVMVVLGGNGEMQ
jgi:hypothetical protein